MTDQIDRDRAIAAVDDAYEEGKADARREFLAAIEEERARWHGKYQAVQDALDRLAARFSNKPIEKESE